MIKQRLRRPSKSLYTKRINGVIINVSYRLNTITNHDGIYTNFHRIPLRPPSKSLYSETIDGGRINISCDINNDNIKIYTNFTQYISHYSSKVIFTSNTDGVRTSVTCQINKNTNNISFSTSYHKSSDRGVKNNKSCSSYLGVYIAEQILSKLFKNVQRMPYGNPGYDFKCGLDYKIDCKSSCLVENETNNKWHFRISKNKVTDFFLCLAFDNRDDLNPLHVWMIPGHILNHLQGTSISESTLDKWSEYEQSLDKILICCDKMKGE